MHDTLLPGIFTWNFFRAEAAKPLISAGFLWTYACMVAVGNHRLADASIFLSFPCILSSIPMMTLSIAHVAPDEIPSLLYQFPDQAKFCHDRDQQRPRSYGHPPSPHLGLPLDP